MRISFIFLCLVSIISCRNNELNKNSINTKKIHCELINVSQGWKTDSTGCEKVRSTIIDEKRLNYGSLEGLKVKYVYQYLGEPNRILRREKETKIYYFLGCKYAPEVLLDISEKNGNEILLDKTRINTESERLLITFNEDSLIIKSNLIVP